VLLECTYIRDNKSFFTERDQCPRRSFDTELRPITPKVWCIELWFLCTALFLNKIYLPITFQVSSLNTFWVMLRTKFKNENEQRAITLKVWSFALWFFCTALLLNEIYLPMLMPCIVFKLCSGQKAMDASFYKSILYLYYKWKRLLKKTCCKQCGQVKFMGTMTK